MTAFYYADEFYDCGGIDFNYGNDDDDDCCKPDGKCAIYNAN